MLTIFTQLNELGAAFSFDEHGWGPSCVFIYYREKELITGEINEIAWTGGGNYVIRRI